jgi:ATPase subunit of ABC transporter with duplicated ATPase domains
MGINIVFAAIYVLISLYIDSKNYNTFRHNDNNQIKLELEPMYINADENVINEAQRVERGEDQMMIKVKNATKIYPSGKPAVREVSFGISKNEIVGLLGPNEAGKSTLLKMLTMDISKTNGEIYLMDT